MKCTGPPATTEQCAYLYRLRGHRSVRSTCCTAHATRTIAALGGDEAGSAPMQRDMEALLAVDSPIAVWYGDAI